MLVTTAVPLLALAPDADDASARTRRFVAAAIDVATLLVAIVLAAVAGIGYLLVRTGWGLFDASVFDAFVAASLVLTMLPAWLACQAMRLMRRGATFGQDCVRLRLFMRDGAQPYAPMLRLAMHPLSIPGWLWLAALAGIAGIPWLQIVLLVPALLLFLGGIVSAGIILARPGSPALHDRLAKTAVTRVEHHQ
jgi:hypothetical protein